MSGEYAIAMLHPELILYQLIAQTTMSIQRNKLDAHPKSGQQQETSED